MQLTVLPVFSQNVTIRWEADYHRPAEGTGNRNGSGLYQIEILKFYISGVTFYKEGIRLFSDSSCFLIDLTDSAVTTRFPKECPAYFDRIDFLLGIDSTTNVQGVLGGSLDPANGMYWTWQSGYINFKLEAVATTRKNRIVYHLGGYRHPFNSQRKISLDLTGPEAMILFDSQRFLASIPGELPQHIMSPGRDACTISDQAATAFFPLKP